MRLYTMLGGLVLGAMPAMASAHHSDFHIGIGFPLPSISIGVGGYHHAGYYGRGYYGGYCGPSAYFAPSYYCAPPVVYSAPPAVVYTTPAPVYVMPPQTYYAPAPQQQTYVQPAPQTYYYGR